LAFFIAVHFAELVKACNECADCLASSLICTMLKHVLFILVIFQFTLAGYSQQNHVPVELHQPEFHVANMPVIKELTPEFFYKESLKIARYVAR
jgi:hypothetical protein